MHRAHQLAGVFHQLDFKHIPTFLAVKDEDKDEWQMWHPDGKTPSSNDWQRKVPNRSNPEDQSRGGDHGNHLAKFHSGNITLVKFTEPMAAAVHNKWLEH